LVKKIDELHAFSAALYDLLMDHRIPNSEAELVATSEATKAKAAADVVSDPLQSF